MGLARKICILLSLVGLVALASIAFIKLQSRRHLKHSVRCLWNIQEIQGALHQYYLANEAYPESLSELVPSYFKKTPLCPSTESDTYAATYRKSKECGFTFFCQEWLLCYEDGNIIRIPMADATGIKWFEDGMSPLTRSLTKRK